MAQVLPAKGRLVMFAGFGGLGSLFWVPGFPPCFTIIGFEPMKSGDQTGYGCQMSSSPKKGFPTKNPTGWIEHISNGRFAELNGGFHSHVATPKKMIFLMESPI